MTVVTWVIRRLRAHVAERDLSSREEEGTEGHHFGVTPLNVRRYAGSAALGVVKARERERYRLLFLSVGIFLGSLQTVEDIGHSSVLCGSDTLSKELRECSIPFTGECASQFTNKYEKWRRKVPQGGNLLDSNICQHPQIVTGRVDGIL
jgi:hypothetical protein